VTEHQERSIGHEHGNEHANWLWHASGARMTAYFRGVEKCKREHAGESMDFSNAMGFSSMNDLARLEDR
jgi:hypothetical protein